MTTGSRPEPYMCFMLGGNAIVQGASRFCELPDGRGPRFLTKQCNVEEKLLPSALHVRKAGGWAPRTPRPGVRRAKRWPPNLTDYLCYGI